jgi:predicted Rossmann fold flavoprotein
MKTPEIVIAGAGPAGLIAAGTLGKEGHRVYVVEKNDKTGKKLRITGKGRGNITNSRPKSEFIQAFGRNGKFLYSAFSHFFRDELLMFFRNELHIEVTTERGGRIFPVSQNAHEIADKLTQWILDHHVEILYNHDCRSIYLEKNRVKSLMCLSPQGPRYLNPDAVLLSTGGASYPATGSNGDGYFLARQAGHTIIPPTPALVPLETKNGDRNGLNELNIKNALVTMICNGKKSGERFGEFSFTRYGVSGPVILSMSRDIVPKLQQHKSIRLEIDFKPALDDEKLDKRLIREFTAHSNKKLKNIFRYILPEALGPVCLKETGVSGETPCHSIRSEDRKKIVHWIKHFSLDITGYRSLEEAIVTRGGVHIKEVEPATLQSKRIPNLFFAGEILDLDADTGGFNLQAAFSTGWYAAKGISGYLNNLINGKNY